MASKSFLMRFSETTLKMTIPVIMMTKETFATIWLVNRYATFEVAFILPFTIGMGGWLKIWV